MNASFINEKRLLHINSNYALLFKPIRRKRYDEEERKHKHNHF